MYNHPIPNVTRDQCAIGFGRHDWLKNKRVKISELPIANEAFAEDWMEILYNGEHYKIKLKEFPLKPGKDGLSAFEIARICGYRETEEEFWEDLKGKHGKDGIPGVKGVAGLNDYELAREAGFRGNERAWRILLQNKEANPINDGQAYGRMGSNWRRGPYIVNSEGKLEFQGHEFYFSFEFA